MGDRWLCRSTSKRGRSNDASRGGSGSTIVLRRTSVFSKSSGIESSLARCTNNPSSDRRAVVLRELCRLEGRVDGEGESGLGGDDNEDDESILADAVGLKSGVEEIVEPKAPVQLFIILLFQAVGQLVHATKGSNGVKSTR